MTCNLIYDNGHWNFLFTFVGSRIRISRIENTSFISFVSNFWFKTPFFQIDSFRIQIYLQFIRHYCVILYGYYIYKMTWSFKPKKIQCWLIKFVIRPNSQLFHWTWCYKQHSYLLILSLKTFEHYHPSWHEKPYS